MDHHEQHHQHHLQEREREKKRAREHEGQEQKTSRLWGPRWFVILGIVLIGLALLVWVALSWDQTGV